MRCLRHPDPLPTGVLGLANARGGFHWFHVPEQGVHLHATHCKVFDTVPSIPDQEDDLGPFVYLASYPSIDEAEWAVASLRGAGFAGTVVADRVYATTGAQVWVPEEQFSDAAALLADRGAASDEMPGSVTSRPWFRAVAVVLVLSAGGAAALVLLLNLVYLGLVQVIPRGAAMILTLMFVAGVTAGVVRLVRRR